LTTKLRQIAVGEAAAILVEKQLFFFAQKTLYVNLTTATFCHVGLRSNIQRCRHPLDSIPLEWNEDSLPIFWAAPRRNASRKKSNH
jgi:hypothetical protein